MTTSNTIAKCIISKVGGCFLDRNNILWKIVDGEWIGKRSVYTFDLKAKWLNDTARDNIKVWWCGENSDYNEVFK